MVTNNNILQSGYILKSPNYPYRVEKVLGIGGFGITYLASATVKIGNVSVKAHFAIKEHFMSSDCEREPDTSRVVYSNPAKERVENSRKDFISEARRLQKVGIEHNNIVKVNEVFEANNTAYYVMEFLDGESLRKYVKRKGSLSENEMIDVMAPIIEAVRYLHKNRMTHLYIKPDNIMIVHDENGMMRPVVIDFGLSKHYDKNGNPTSTIKVLGCSDGYAPIEQYAGIMTFSPKADYYALGATMWFCLTGKDPKKSSELLDENLSKSLPETVSCEVKNIISNATAASYNDRKIESTILSAAVNTYSNDIPPVMYGGPTSPRIFDKKSSSTELLVDNHHINNDTAKHKKIIKLSMYGLLAVCAFFTGIFAYRHTGESIKEDDVMTTDSIAKDEQESNIPYTATIPSDFVLVPGGILGDYHELQRIEKDGDYDYIDRYYDVEIDSFYICKYELTQYMFEKIMGKIRPEHFTFHPLYGKEVKMRGDSIPVSASYEEAALFCNKLSEKYGCNGFYIKDGNTYKLDASGNGFRLINKYEYIFAAKGGNSNKKFKYSGSNNLKNVAWFGGNSGMKPHPVGKKAPNSLGIYDLSGNVSETVETPSKSCGSSLQHAGGNYSTYIGFNPDDFWCGGSGSYRIVFIPQNIENRNALLRDKYD